MEEWTLTWTRLTPLNETTVNLIPGELVGVYRLSYKSPAGDFYVFYVGQGEDIRDRLLQHLSTEENNNCIKEHLRAKECFFRYAIITRDYLRSATERAVYKEYRPSCNYLEPEGREDVKMNLT